MYRRSRIVLLTAAFSSLLIVGCGGSGGGGSSTSPASSTPQLRSTAPDLSNSRTTFANVDRVEVASGTFSLFAWLERIFSTPLVRSALAQSSEECSEDVKPIAVDLSSTRLAASIVDIASTPSRSNPCYLSSQEAGGFIAAQARNLFKGDQRCDLLLIPKAGGPTHCFTVNLPEQYSLVGSEPVFKLNQSFAGISSLAALGGQITKNGRYFFVAFSDRGLNSSGYDGVYRVDLSGQSPQGGIVYLKDSVNPRNLAFDGYQPLENGDLIVGHRENLPPVLQQRRFVYYVDANAGFQTLESQRIILINSAIQFGFDSNSPMFKWAIENLSQEPITDGGSQNIIFSASSDPTVKTFYILMGPNRYRSFQGAYFNQVLLKGSIVNNTLTFEDYGPSSISFFGTVSLSDDLQSVYWVKDWNPGQLSIITRRLEKSFDDTDRNYIPESELALSVSIPANHRPTLLYPTENYIFISTIPPDFYDRNNLMTLELYVAPKPAPGLSWATLRDQFQKIDFGVFASEGYQVQAVVPSLVSDNLNFRLRRLSDNKDFSLDISPSGVDTLDLGSRGAVPNAHAVVRGRK